MNGIVVFFIGTIAELIKLFPIINRLGEERVPYKIISSGQNNIYDSELLRIANGGRVDLILSDEGSIVKSGLGLLKWWFSVYYSGTRKIKEYLKEYNCEKSVFVVHGDTVSTVMGALIGKKLNIPVAHVEAGLRSFHYLSPFPEELDRVITSKLACVSFAPGEQACKNLEDSNTEIINTYLNTAIDSLEYAKRIRCSNTVIRGLVNSEFFVFVLHRQENLANKEFVLSILEKVIEVSNRIQCVLILHKITERKLNDYGAMSLLQKNPGITLLERQEYFDFIYLLAHSSFVITDGGSNQEELSYLGKPCLIIRNHTERLEGIGENAVMFNGDPDMIPFFAEARDSYRREAVPHTISPTEIITSKLIQMI